MTKIFNGYILPTTSLSNLKKMCVSLRETLYDTYIDISHKKFAEKCCNLIDQNYFGINYGNFIEKKIDSEKNFFIPYVETFKRINKQQEENRGKFHDLNFEFNITFIPSKKSILALTDCNYSQEYLHHWENLPNVHEYQYWDIFEKPPYVSNKEWLNRKKNWENVLGDAINESGFNITILSNNVVFNASKIIEKQPSIISRLKTCVELLTIQQEFEHLFDKSLTTNESIKMFFQIKKDIADGIINTDELYKKVKHDLKKLDENILLEKIEINSKLTLIN